MKAAMIRLPLALLVLCWWLLPATVRAAGPGPPRAIYTMNVDGTDVRRVVHIESFPWLGAPRFSHDGRRLLFEAHGQRPSRALIIDVTGRNLYDLGAGQLPDWSPDDKQVIFEVPNVGKSSTWIQNASGKGNSWLATGGAPRWKPDGSQIAIRGPLRLLDAITLETRSVFKADDHVDEAVGYDWSPDGRRLAVVVKRGGARELLLVDVDGPAVKLSVRLRAEVHGAPAWSPDGKQLAVAINDPKQDKRSLYLLSVDGDDPPRLIPGQQGDTLDPAFSPDGKRLAFASSRD